MAPAITIFVGVPISVDIPPMEALYAIESINALAKVLLLTPVPSELSFNCLMMTMPMGSIITEVAVLEIHMERKAVASIKPKMIFRISVPIK